MNIRIRIQSPGFHLNSVLQPEALPLLIDLVQKHRIADPAKLAAPTARKQAREAKRLSRKAGIASIALEETPPALDPESEALQEKMAGLDVAAVLNATRDGTFPEKLVALAALTLAKGPQATVRPRDIKAMLVAARQDPPANPGRDFRQAWHQGWLTRVQAREFVLTNEGWQKAAQLTGI